MHFQVGLLGSLSWEKSDSVSDQIPRALCLRLYVLQRVISACYKSLLYAMSEKANRKVTFTQFSTLLQV